MATARTPRPTAADLPEGDVIRLLLEQHDRIRGLFDSVEAAEGEERRRTFDELRALLAVHETAEEMVLRPISRQAAGADVADARNAEESEANEVLAQLEHLDPDGPEFGSLLATLRTAVEQHAENEETHEFPPVLAAHDEGVRRGLGTQVRAAEALAPTHPHPSVAGSPLAQWALGPMASLVDRTRDAIRAATK